VYSVLLVKCFHCEAKSVACFFPLLIIIQRTAFTRIVPNLIFDDVTFGNLEIH